MFASIEGSFRALTLIPGAPRWVLATVGSALPSAPVCPPLAAAAPVTSPGRPLSFAVARPHAGRPRARSGEGGPGRGGGAGAEPEPPPSPTPRPVAGPEPEPRPTPVAVSRRRRRPRRPSCRPPTPIPTPTPTPVPAVPSPAPSPSPEVAPEGGAPQPRSRLRRRKRRPEEAPTSLIEKLPTFQDIDDIDLTTLLKVTAGEDGTRTADDEPGHVTVISEEDIRRTGARTVMEVLQSVPGLEVLTDSLGRARIFVRGVPGGAAAGSSENVLVTLNGLRLNESVFGGATAVNLDLPVDNIKRIEIVRGPGSVLNGPGAVLGAIHIVTESVDTFRRDELAVGGGSFKSFLYNYRYGTTFREVSLAGFLQYTYTGGPELDVPVDAQTIRDLAAGPARDRRRSRSPPARPTTTARRLDANLSMAFRKLTFHARLKKENSGGFVGLLDTLGQQNRLANTQGNLSLEYRRALRHGRRARARVLYRRASSPSSSTCTRPASRSCAARRAWSSPAACSSSEDLNSRRFGGDAVPGAAARHPAHPDGGRAPRARIDVRPRRHDELRLREAGAAARLRLRSRRWCPRPRAP